MSSQHLSTFSLFPLLRFSILLLHLPQLIASPSSPRVIPASRSLTSRAPSIQCFDFPQEPTAYRKTSLDGCRPTLNAFKTFPAWRVVQDFLEGFFPFKPDKPPYYIAMGNGDCSIEIASHDQPKVKDKFSFEQVKDLAQQILEECQEPDQPGRGGEAPIGSKGIWKVTVRGWKRPDGAILVDGKFYPEELGEKEVVPVEASR